MPVKSNYSYREIFHSRRKIGPATKREKATVCTYYLALNILQPETNHNFLENLPIIQSRISIARQPCVRNKNTKYARKASSRPADSSAT